MVSTDPLMRGFGMNSLSLLQRHRLQYQPLLPSLLDDVNAVISIQEEQQGSFFISDPSMQELFPHTMQQPILAFKKGISSAVKPLKVGVILSGGQAPGGHNVITGLWDALKKMNPHAQLIGFLNGPSGIIQNKFIDLTEEIIAPYRNQGGFDLIGSGRTKIQTPGQFEAVGQTLKVHGLDGLVIIGGDDSNTNAAFLAEFCQQRGLPTRIIGVPKTIDGDLKNTFIEISFGFDTASKIYSEIIGNLSRDALSAKKYYFFIKMMGRSASHITLECALQTRVNLALIGEEVAYRKQTLRDVVEHVADLVCERAQKDKDFGVILVPEGLLEFIPECQEMIQELNTLLISHPPLAKQLEQATSSSRLDLIKRSLNQKAAECFSLLPEEIQKQLLLDRDPHGNIQLSKIETERLLITLVERELTHRKQQGTYIGKFNPQPLFCGYEGRSGLPSNFDCQYCYALGHVAALLIRDGATGYMCCLTNLTQPIEKWEVYGVPIVNMLHFEIRKNKKQAVIQKALVDLEGPVFAVFKQQRERWRLEDLYCSPGPIQFDGSYELTQRPVLTLLYEKQVF
jgi:pyrophosphate--fructose-6-phosphate 1-phosphotransferase